MKATKQEGEKNRSVREKPRQLRIAALGNLVRVLSREVETLEASQNSQNKDSQPQIDFYEEVRRFEIELIQGALSMSLGSQVRAAQLLKLRNTTLNSLIKRYEIACGSSAWLGAKTGETGPTITSSPDKR